MQRVLLSSLSSRLPGYEHVAALISFLRRVQDELHPAAVILFGSLAKGNYYLHSDADVCVILVQSEVSWGEGYERVAPLDPEGVIQPLIYGSDQFFRMLSDANAMALEICHDGWVIASEADYIHRLEETFEQAKLRYHLEKTKSGWLIHRL